MRAVTRRDEMLVLTESATAVGLSVLAGNLRLIELPAGGSVTLAAIPLLALACVRGLRTGLLACICAGAAHAAAGGTIVHPIQLLLDYLVGYGVLALSALARSGRGAQLGVWLTIAFAAQLAASTTSGVVFFGAALGEHALRASLIYNALAIVPEYVIALVLVPEAVRALRRADPATHAPHVGVARVRTPRYVTPRARPHARARPARTKLHWPARAAAEPQVQAPTRSAIVRPAPFS